MSRQAMELALEHFIIAGHNLVYGDKSVAVTSMEKGISALKEAIKQHDAEPVAMFKKSPAGTVYIETVGGLDAAFELVDKPLYTSPLPPDELVSSEPVAYIWFNQYTLDLSDHPKENFIPLYLSAPSIPEGFVLVPKASIEWLKKYKSALCAKAGLFAAPNPE